MRCPDCKTELRHTMVYCPHCSAELFRGKSKVEKEMIFPATLKRIIG